MSFVIGKTVKVWSYLVIVIFVLYIFVFIFGGSGNQMHYFIFVMLVFRLPGLLWGGYSGVFGSFLGNILLFLNFLY